MSEHKWSGWPGAYCLKCFASDPIEQAIADNWYDSLDDTWDTEEHRLMVEKANVCPVDEVQE